MRHKAPMVALGLLVSLAPLQRAFAEGPPAFDASTDLPAGKGMGMGCTSSTECDTTAPSCVLWSLLFPAVQGVKGICTTSCTPDDPNTPLIDEDTCPSSFICIKMLGSSYCLKKCQPSTTTNPCPPSSGQTCSPLSTYYSGSLTVPVCLYPACTTGKDCPVYHSKTCASDPDCTSVASDAFCEKQYSVCARPGTCTAGGLCGKHSLGKATAKVGDPCTSDLDCTNGGYCFTEALMLSGSIGVSYRNGYCTIPFCSFASALPEFTCPSGSTCFRLYYGGMCFLSCKLDDAKTCRNHAQDKGGDYECYGWDQLYVSGGVKVADTPLCSNAPTQRCDTLSSSMDCSNLGDVTNSTNMDCRDRYTGDKKTQKKDPTGICLDDTASGPFQQPSPDGSAPDQALPDTVIGADSVPAMPDTATADAAAKMDSGGSSSDGDGCSCRLLGDAGNPFPLPPALLLLPLLLLLCRRKRS